MTILRWTALMALALPFLAACGERDISLRSFRATGNGPEEFAILPNKPLQSPSDYNNLPAPTPGGANRSDLTPRADAVAAMGGQPQAMAPSGVPSDEAALVNHASRNGRDASIRPRLAQEDEEFRRRQSLFTKLRLFSVDRYYQAYRGHTLDADAEARRWRRAGAPTPSSPPGG